MHKSQRLNTKVGGLSYIHFWSLTGDLKQHDAYDVRSACWNSRDRRQQHTLPESSFLSRYPESPNLAKDSRNDSASSSETDLHCDSDEVTWPPPGLTRRSELIACDADVLICNGACYFVGYVSVMPSNLEQYRCYAFAGSMENENLECQDISASVGITNWMTLTLEDHQGTVNPWDTLEQPSMLLCFGTTPGTITLNQWAGLCNHNTPSETSPKSAAQPRELDLLSILDRISLVQRGLEDDVSSGLDILRGMH